MASTHKEVFDSDLSTRVPTPVPGSERDVDIPTADGSTRAPSIIDGVNAEKESKVDGDAEKGDTAVDAVEPQYPEGARLIFIVVALVLSIFLVALDMVGGAPLVAIAAL